MTAPMPHRGPVDRVRDKLTRWARRRKFLTSVRHLHGPARLETRPGATIVVTMIKDGAYYLDAFFDHYRAMGIRHFVFFDNGSTDGSLARIAAEPGTVVVQSLLPITFESEFRNYAAERFCRDRWCLFADTDELFDFEGREEAGISGLTGYLEQNGYDGLVAQMLDLFPDRPLCETGGLPFAEAIDACRFYDLSQIDRVPYHDAEAIAFSWYLRDNTLGNPEIAFLFGGVRRKIFGEYCCLTKHPLVFVGGAVKPGIHPHCSSGLRCADFTALIRHYKFANDPVGRDARTVKHNPMPHGEDRQRLSVYDSDPDLSLYSADAQPFTGIAPLYREGFLIRSGRYSTHLAALGEAPDA